ncbi:FeoB-associated Cys-rich membrane protein [Staphylococcus delphini]|uniref:Virus attachment p12 family protein n=1 Tax=Staphylococcus delphini TaxID=53344 RepID=A0A2A4GWW8_9STAP|nr:FeoB-associated Cys-rich membrane protein [Staphylococcus delphini]MBZ8175607.1 FeoB-associated Cys-rich membrane protein [Staphylococcus delphini]PCF55114.1 virus attachment p12 family protein [Staphylococcus delphini]PCF61990.1 virus attachment p12 family protein [Staphylococcus delphini]PCF73955.1 virus attachment p12 family protein [Staphylococcus delphini]UXS21352.1 FeoB-associated Cys-rich membrane protein [Staphylococcus delphini]
MTLFINLLLIALILGYATWVMVRFFKKSKQGKCSACESSQGCPTENLPKHLQ